MSTQTQLLLGTKSIPLNELPEEAWRIFAGDREGEQDVQKFYKRVGLLYRCVDIRMSSIANVPWQLYRNDSVVWSSDDDEIPDDLLWLEDWPVLLALTEAALCLRSEAFWFKKRNRAVPLGLQWLSPLSVLPKWDEDKGLVSFERQLSRTKKTLPLDEVVYIWNQNPLHETERRISPAEAAMSAAGVLYNVDMFVSGFFERGAIKATLLTVEGTPAPAERERLKAWWERFFSGVRKAWGSEVVSASVKPIVVGEGIQELSNTELTGEKRADLVSTMGVPHSKLFSDAANYATAQQDDLGFYRDTIIPDCRLIARTVNKQLLNPLGLRLKFTPETMDVFQVDEHERSQSFTNYVNAGMKLSVVAEMLGIELPEGVEYEDLDAVAEEQAALEAEQEAARLAAQQQRQPPPASQPPTEQESTEEKRLSDLDKWRRKAQKRMDGGKAALCDFDSQWLTPLEIAYIRHGLNHATTKEAIDFAFKPQEVGFDQPFFILRQAQGKPGKAIRELPGSDGDDEKRSELEKYHADKIHAALRKLLRAVAPAGTTIDNITPDSAWQRYKEHEKVLRDAIIEMLMDGAQLGADTGIKQVEAILGVGKATITGVNWDLVNEAVLQWVLGGQGFGFGNGYADTITQALASTSETQIRRNLAEWVSNRLSYSILLDNLERTVFSAERARRIAVTEISKSFYQGNLAAWRESNVISRIRWNTVASEDVCQICRPLNGVTTNIGEPFRHPNGQTYEIPGHVACRCFASPVVD